MKIEKVTEEQFEEATGRSANQFKEILTLLKEGPVRIGDLTNRMSFGTSLRSAANRQGIAVRILTDKKDSNAVFVTIKELEEDEEEE